MTYSKQVLDHYNNPRNAGVFDKKDPSVGTGMAGSPDYGTVISLQIKVNANNRIEEARFKTYGCGSAIAASSLMTEKLKGKTIDDALQIKNTEITKELHLPPAKIHCAILAEDALKAAINHYQLNQNTKTA